MLLLPLLSFPLPPPHLFPSSSSFLPPSSLSSILTLSVPPAPSFLHQTHLSNQGYLLRFLAMIWTAPVGGTEPDATTLQSHSTSTVTPATQARSLAVFASHLRSLPSESALALTTPLCPGTAVVESVAVALLLSVCAHTVHPAGIPSKQGQLSQQTGLILQYSLYRHNTVANV